MSAIVQNSVSSMGVMEPRSLRSLSSREQMHTALSRQQMISDVDGRPFSLALFGRPADRDARPTLRLAKAVLGRARNRDLVGWINDDCICVILPDSSTAGAHHFAKDVISSVNKWIKGPICTLYTYPNNIWSMTDGRQIKPWRADRIQSLLTRVHQPVPQLKIRPIPMWKRAMDIVGAILGLIAFMPLMVLIATVIRLTSSGPVLFRQPRAGLGGKPFNMFKFRTMVADAESRRQMLVKQSEQDGPAFKMSNDPRITRVGKFLRRTSLDELPQFWNVLRGDMSLVGPRPLPCVEASSCTAWQQRRVEVTPGITCYWQVQGRSTVSFCQWVRMDLAYVRNRSFWTDIKLILRTIPAVLGCKGAH